MTAGLSRRRFLRGAGAIVIGFSLGGPPSSTGQVALPSSLRRHPRVDSWLRVDADGQVTLLTGKVELGQGIGTALAQIAAEELDVPISRMSVVTADTAETPNEGYTAGSMSVQQSGAAIRQAAAELRFALLKLAADRWSAPLSSLEVREGLVSGSGGKRASYAELAKGLQLNLEVSGEAKPKEPGSHRLVGQSVPRLDLPAKVFGEPVYVHDLRLEGMLHGRIVRPPTYDSRLITVDIEAVTSMPGVVDVVRDGSFLGLVAKREEQAERAAAELALKVRWTESGASLPRLSELEEFLIQAPAETSVLKKVGVPPESPKHELEASYFKPYLAHASIGPSCAVALYDGSTLTVWTHAQGPFPLRSALSKVLGVPEETIRVVHREGAGCYGHNGADDAACDAALLGMAVPGRPVRVQWSREDEFRWEPFGSAMSVRMSGAVDGEGRIVGWKSEHWSCPHSTRPGRQASLLAAWHRATPEPLPTPFNIPQPSGGMDRNALPLYDLPHQEIVEHFIAEMPIRVSALRSLGAFGNVFAIESFVDELARVAGQEPLSFRLRHLRDPRARAVIERAAASFGWTDRAVNSPGGRPIGRGLAFARYKNLGAYLALVVGARVDLSTGVVRLERVVAAVDAGQVINPNGLRNQIEGGIVQAASWTLKERVTFDQKSITSVDWRGYPILGFEEVPEIAVEIVDRPTEPSLGVGEAAQGPTAAAIANSVADAVRVRVRSLPLEPATVLAGLGARG